MQEEFYYLADDESDYVVFCTKQRVDKTPETKFRSRATSVSARRLRSVNMKNKRGMSTIISPSRRSLSPGRKTLINTHQSQIYQLRRKVRNLQQNLKRQKIK